MFSVEAAPFYIPANGVYRDSYFSTHLSHVLFSSLKKIIAILVGGNLYPTVDLYFLSDLHFFSDQWC